MIQRNKDHPEHTKIILQKNKHVENIKVFSIKQGFLRAKIQKHFKIFMERQINRKN